METYQSWNHALSQYFLQGVPRGSHIYLSVDDAVLEAIGQQQFETEPLNGSWREDLIAAVREKIVSNDQQICLDLICFRDREFKIPSGVAFLAVCVLAAYDMQNDGKISSKAYFERLRHILQLPGSGRPAEMKRASRSYTGFGDFEYLDETLWRQWNYWLKEKDFVTTARRGAEGPQKYINYPISQCLLRQTDRDELWQYFDQHDLRTSLDAYVLFNKIRVDKQCFKKHLSELILDIERRDALIDLVQESHQQWLELGCPSLSIEQTINKRQSSSTIFAGLFRRYDYDEDLIEYYPYPKQKPLQNLSRITVTYKRDKETIKEELVQDRPGWYEYIDTVLYPKQLSREQEYKVISPPSLQRVKLLERDFWVLVLDPDDPESGTYATWRTTNSQEPFIFLCKRTLLSDLQRLRGSQIVDWSDEYLPFEDSEDWIELHEFSILSKPRVNPFFIQNSELEDFISSQPTTKHSISISGGLRAPNQMAWLQGHAPIIKIMGDTDRTQLEIRKLPHEDLFFLDSPEEMGSGDYLLCLGEIEKHLKIINWDKLVLDIVPTKSQFGLDLPLVRINGAFLTLHTPPNTNTNRNPTPFKKNLKIWFIGFTHVGEPHKFMDEVAYVISENNLSQKIGSSIHLFQAVNSRKRRREFSFFLSIKSEAVGNIPRDVQSKLLSLPFFSKPITVSSWGKTVSQNKKVFEKIVGNHRLVPYPIPQKIIGGIYTDFNDISFTENNIDSNCVNLLDWLSAKGYGSWATFKNVCQSLEIEHPGRVLRTLKLLGYIETSSNGKKWAIAPTAIVPLNPDPENLEFYLCGQQNTCLRQDLAKIADIKPEGQPTTFGLPRWKVIFSDRITYDHLEKLGEIPIHKPGNIAQRLAECLPTIQEWQASLPEVGGIVKSQRHWRRYRPETQNWQDYGLPDQTGLYEMRREADQPHPDRTYFYEAETDKWRQSDWYGLRFLALHHSRKLQECVYRVDQKQLAILSSERWPQLYERALVLASDYLPSWHNTQYENWLIYRNITADLAYYLTELLSLTCRGL